MIKFCFPEQLYSSSPQAAHILVLGHIGIITIMIKLCKTTHNPKNVVITVK